MLRRPLLQAAAALPAAALATPARAQGQWPERAVRMLVPFPPGGPTDIVARLLSQRLGEALGQPVVVDNRGGAGGNVGAEQVARAAPDGYSLLVATVGVLAINPVLYRRLSYDPAADLTAIAVVAAAPVAVTVHPSLPARTVQELVALSRARPGTVQFGSAGNGTPGHLAGEIFNRLTGAGLTHLAYRGSAPALQDLIAGHIGVMFDPVQSQLAAIQGGQVRALALSNPRRIAALPNVPTMAEAGVAEHQTTAWWAIAAPSRTPPAVLARIEQAIQRIAETESWREHYAQRAIEPVLIRGPALAEFLARERRNWGDAVRASGATAE
jgi:tripartite-type tricarboxylate transporter receptor subunit TctC